MPAVEGIRRRRRGIPGAVDFWVPITVLLLVVLACFLGPRFGRLPPATGADISQAGLPLWSAHHLLGTDPLGNDLLSRALAGGRLSLVVSITSNALGFLVGGLLGIASGFRGGRMDRVIATVLDVLMAFPSLVFSLAIAAGLGPGELHVILALAFFGIPAYARLVRALTLELREERFVDSARLVGASSCRIILTHVVPNVLHRLSTFACFGFSVTVTLEASLSYLGLGIRPPEPSWGNMIAQGQEYLAVEPSLVLVPSALLCVVLLSLNLLADSVRRRSASG